MTSTGFHLAWVADLALHPTFQLTLMSTRSPSVHLETRNASLTLWGLEPGVLHHIEIVSKACGRESARAHLKVRTGKGFPKRFAPFVLKGRGKFLKEGKEFWWVKVEKSWVNCGLQGFHFLPSVETSGSLHTQLAWGSQTGGGSVQGQVLGDGGQRAPDSACSATSCGFAAGHCVRHRSV